MLLFLFLAILIALKLLATVVVGYFGVGISFIIIVALIAIAYRCDAGTAA